MMANNPVLYVLLLQDIYEGKNVRCPMCHSYGLKHKFYAKSSDRIGFVRFHCDNCGVEEHLSRVKFPENVETEEF